MSDDLNDFEEAQVRADHEARARLDALAEQQGCVLSTEPEPRPLHGPWKFGDDGEMQIALVGDSLLYQERFKGDGDEWEPWADGDPHPLADELVRLANELTELRETEASLRESYSRFVEDTAANVKAIADERDRLAAENRDLRLEVDCEAAVLAMTVARLGGMVEGYPTHRINFLQRIDELREVEVEAAELRAEVLKRDQREATAAECVAATRAERDELLRDRDAKAEYSRQILGELEAERDRLQERLDDTIENYDDMSSRLTAERDDSQEEADRLRALVARQGEALRLVPSRSNPEYWSQNEKFNLGVLITSHMPDLLADPDGQAAAAHFQDRERRAAERWKARFGKVGVVILDTINWLNGLDADSLSGPDWQDEMQGKLRAALEIDPLQWLDKEREEAVAPWRMKADFLVELLDSAACAVNSLLCGYPKEVETSLLPRIQAALASLDTEALSWHEADLVQAVNPWRTLVAQILTAESISWDQGDVASLPVQALSWLSAREASAHEAGRKELASEMAVDLLALTNKALAEGRREGLKEAAREARRRAGQVDTVAADQALIGLAEGLEALAEKPEPAPAELNCEGYVRIEGGGQRRCTGKLGHKGRCFAPRTQALAEKPEPPAPAPGHWLVSICREGVTEVTLFDAEDEARTFFASASLQWSESFLSRVEIGPRDLGIASKLRETSLACRWREEENDARYCYACGKPLQAIPYAEPKCDPDDTSDHLADCECWRCENGRAAEDGEEPPVADSPVPKAQVIDLMAALRASLAAAGKAKKGGE